MRVKCPAQEHNACPSKGSNPDRSIGSPAHKPFGHRASHQRTKTYPQKTQFFVSIQACRVILFELFARFNLVNEIVALRKSPAENILTQEESQAAVFKPKEGLRSSLSLIFLGTPTPYRFKLRGGGAEVGGGGTSTKWQVGEIKRSIKNSCKYQCLKYIYSYFEKGCRKKNIKVHATRPKGGLGIHWNFAYLGKFTSLYFCTWRICFSSQEAYICSFTFTVACL